MSFVVAKNFDDFLIQYELSFILENNEIMKEDNEGNYSVESVDVF